MTARCGACDTPLGRFTSRSGPIGERMVSKPNGYVSIDLHPGVALAYAQQVDKARRNPDGSWTVELSLAERSTLAVWRKVCRSCGADHIVRFPRLRAAIKHVSAEGRHVVVIPNDLPRDT